MLTQLEAIDPDDRTHHESMVDLKEDLLAALSVEKLANLVDDMVTGPNDKYMPASVRIAYRCEKDPHCPPSTAPTVKMPRTG